MASLFRGNWTKPGDPRPSSHLVANEPTPITHTCRARCGRFLLLGTDPGALLAEPPARGKTCESCLRLSRRDG